MGAGFSHNSNLDFLQSKYDVDFINKSFYINHNFNTQNIAVIVNRFETLFDLSLNISNNKIFENDDAKFYILNNNYILVKPKKIGNYKIQIIKDYFDKPNDDKFQSNLEIDTNYYNNLQNTKFDRPIIFDYSGTIINSFFNPFLLNQQENYEFLQSYDNIFQYFFDNISILNEEFTNLEYVNENIFYNLRNTFTVQNESNLNDLDSMIGNFIFQLQDLFSFFPLTNVNQYISNDFGLYTIIQKFISIFYSFIIPNQIIEVSNFVMKNIGNDVGFIDMNSLSLKAKRKINDNETDVTLKMIHDFNDIIPIDLTLSQYFIEDYHPYLSNILAFLKNEDANVIYNAFNDFKKLTKVDNFQTYNSNLNNFYQSIVYDFSNELNIYNHNNPIIDKFIQIFIKNIIPILQQRSNFSVLPNKNNYMSTLFFKSWFDEIFSSNNDGLLQTNANLNSNFQEIDLNEYINISNNNKIFNNLFLSNTDLTKLHFYKDDDVVLNFKDITGKNYSIDVKYILITMDPLNINSGNNGGNNDSGFY